MIPENLIPLQSMFAASNITLEQIAEEQRDTVAELRRANPLPTVCTYAGMLANPALQSNAFRLEALVHLAVIHSIGRSHPSTALIRRTFARAGHGICGRFEDPAEDVFSSSVNTRSGNYTVFEGLREGNGFYLQQILDVVEGMPEGEPFKSFRESVQSLLILSNAVALRAEVGVYEVGQSMPMSEIPSRVIDQLGRIRNSVLFRIEDLSELGTSFELLRPFVFTPYGVDVSKQTLGNTYLERCPVIRLGNSICLALPTAVGSAITRFVIERVRSQSAAPTFERALARQYAKLLGQTPLVRKIGRIPVQFQRHEGEHIGSALAELDRGRFLHVLVIVEGISDFEITGLTGITPAVLEQSRVAMDHIKKAHEAVSRNGDFRGGLTLVVSCGVGRASLLAMEAAPDNWRIEFCPVHDVVSLSWMDGFEALDLWRILDSKEALERAGITLLNVNGLLNLVAWADDLNGNLVPHGELPTNFREEGKRIVFVRQNALLDLRRSVHIRSHTRAALDSDGMWVRVRKQAESLFDEDVLSPLYIDEEALTHGELRAVYVSDSRFWWVHIQAGEDSDRAEIYEHWRMLCNWMVRAAPVLDGQYTVSLPRVVLLRFCFPKLTGVSHGTVELPSPSQVSADIQTTNDRARGVSTIQVGSVFDDALASPDNLAERALVVAIVDAVHEISGTDLREAVLSELVDRICSSPQARSRHRIHAQNFRDMIGRNTPLTPVTMSALDSGFYRIGLAFRVKPDIGSELSGVTECTSFLNKATQTVLDELCDSLKEFNRIEFVQSVLENHESIAMDREHWQRTAHANVALHHDRECALEVITQHIAEMNSCSIASRILIEAAICECPSEGGKKPGELDITRAMTRAMLAFHIGGWSDAVHWGAIQPRLRINPVGDIQIDHTFMDQIYTPFVRTGEERQVQRAIDLSRSIYVEPEVTATIPDVFEQRFLRSWESEYHISLDAFRAFVDELEKIGVRENSLFFCRKQSELTALLGKLASTSEDQANEAIKLLILPSRVSWRVVGTDFRDKDWHPWRFRRRLSLVRRPLIQLGNSDDPRLIVAPAVVREALYILLRSMYSGETPDWQVCSVEMRKWLGHVNNIERTAFNRTVSLKMEELGWKSEPDYKVSRLLGISLDRDYGDIDALAWHPDSRRVIAIECKDLHFHKTMGEVAEQLSDFRGSVSRDGKRDLLRKHLDRLTVLEQHKPQISKRLSVPKEIEIEGYVVFRNAVPMQFAWDNISHLTGLLMFDDLHSLRRSS